MARKPPTGPHADVAERFAFLLDALDLDREGFAAAVDDAVSARSLFAILSGDRRPSRSLAVLIERTFGFRADHLLHGTGAMWVAEPAAPPAAGLTEQEERLIGFVRRSVDNARLAEEELAQLQAWEQLWTRATGLLADLEHAARGDDPHGYPDAATRVLEECWRMADAFAAWTTARDQRRVVHLTRLFVQRFLVQVPVEMQQRGALTDSEGTTVQARARELLDDLADDLGRLDQQIATAAERIDRLTTAPHVPTGGADLGDRLGTLVTRIDRLRPGLA